MTEGKCAVILFRINTFCCSVKHKVFISAKCCHSVFSFEFSHLMPYMLSINVSFKRKEYSVLGYVLLNLYDTVLQQVLTLEKV